jgi:hypothetical protein
MNKTWIYRKTFLLLSLLIVSSVTVIGQETVWSPVENALRIEKKRSAQRQSFPRSFKLFSLNRGALD